ncbi:MAG TPA: hypothetical protein VM847_18650 [Tahibacter sp.]|jgi:hypothetical protein|nr:hypothetical protein [Tahibacter sp.]
MRKSNLVVAMLLSAASACVSGQSARSETEFVGQAVVLDRCPVSPSSLTKGDLDQRPESGLLALAGGAFLAGVAGDLTTAGMNALGAALEEASREKGFSAAAWTEFPYYRIDLTTDSATGALTPSQRPWPQAVSSICLVLSYRNTDLAERPIEAAEITSIVPDIKIGNVITEWTNYGLSSSPDLYVEAELQKREDGFIVRPVLVWYRQALPKAPKRELVTELHATFSTPAAPSAETSNGQSFAVARIRLPNMQPDRQLGAAALARYASVVVPARPMTGSATDVLARLNQVTSDWLANRKSVTELKRSVEAAEAAAQAPGASAETKAKVAPLRLQLAAAEDAARIADLRLNALKGEKYPLMTGSTNVQFRFTVVRDANKFGLALANSLKTRSAALGQAVTTSLTPTAPGPAWTAADTNYVTAMTGVESAQRALDVALAGGDATAIFEKQIALKNAKAAANAAAAASNRPLPFPGLI